MGIYTSLKFKAKIKPEYVNALTEVLEAYSWDDTECPLFQEWKNMYRAVFIPWGDQSQLRPEWDEEFEKHRHSKFIDGYWSVITALKGYLEFEVFYKMLKEMSEHIEYYITWHECEAQERIWK